MSKKAGKYLAANILNSTNSVILLGAKLIVTKNNNIYFKRDKK